MHLISIYFLIYILHTIPTNDSVKYYVILYMCTLSQYIFLMYILHTIPTNGSWYTYSVKYYVILYMCTLSQYNFWYTYCILYQQMVVDIHTYIYNTTLYIPMYKMHTTKYTYCVYIYTYTLIYCNHIYVKSCIYSACLLFPIHPKTP